MSPKIQKPRPPYQQIADHYREEIANGVLAEGQRLPTVAELTQIWGTSPGTAHKALLQLRGEGLIITKQQGSTVAPRRVVPQLAEKQRRTELPIGDQVVITDAGVVPMLPSVGSALGINADALNMRVVRREAISRSGDKPYKLSVSWLPVHLIEAVPELTREDVLPNLVLLISERANLHTIRGRSHHEARVADEREANALNVSVGDTVLAEAVVYSDGESAILYYEAVYPSKHVVTSEFEIDQ